ncbi:MAG: Do family serine endopeptidase [Alphaproteobacteria bacterium]|nr:Do family serine endopeptidase [Alphaproteobacteria bacterium]NCQ88826.1 Do family serine endopeptidase [Alphaproteobacteria bacterium]NCT07251.1 Do family serine endopeptidase [Alphaproteobacteria bacterium]
MRKFLLLVGIGFMMIGAGAFATERNVPQARSQIMLSYAPLVKRVSPAVVNIYTKRVVTKSYSPFGGDPFFEQFFGNSFGGLNRQQLESALGSGVILDKSGLVVTNAHVIKDAQEISVVLSDGREFDARVSIKDDRSDLAILRIDPKGEDLPYVNLSASESLEVGDIVIAIGNPFGVGQTVTSGIVSALARSSLNINDFNFFIQTDAAINPGNSGGPLVAMDGTVVGINTAIYSRTGGSLGIGFAIPSEMVQTVLAAEKTGESNVDIARPWIGASGQAVTADIADSIGLSRPKGVLINKLHSQSPAKKAGMSIGDVVISINGREINDPAEMKFRLATVPLGESADMTVLRRGEEKTFSVLAMAPPDKPDRDETTLTGNHLLNGAIIGRINPRVAVELNMNNEDREGVVVMGFTDRAPASRIVAVGDIILSLNGEEIDDIKDLTRELDQAIRRGTFDLVTERQGRRNQIVIR